MMFLLFPCLLKDTKQATHEASITYKTEISQEIEKAQESETLQKGKSNKEDTVDTENIETLLQNKNQELLYFESVINIEPFLFLIEINSLSNYGVNKIIENMIFPIQISLENLLTPTDESKSVSHKKKLVELLNNLSNFSKSVSIINEPTLSKSIEMRNMFFLNDKSQIAKQLYLENLQTLKDLIKEVPNDEVLKLLKIENLAIKRLKYQKMFEEFIKTIMQTGNLQKIIKTERENFFNLFLFSNQLDLLELKKVRMIMNLGGSFILPSLMYNLNEKLLHPEKEEFLHKILFRILKPIETLKLLIRHKSTNEKKFLIIKFLNECLKNSNLYTEAFESRSALLQIYFNGDVEKIHKIDFYQDLMLKKYIRYLEKVDVDYFERFLVLNKETMNSYYQYLNTRQTVEKERLEEYFDRI